MTETVRNLLSNLQYSLDQLLNDIELSTAGQDGAHKSAMRRVRSSFLKLKEELNGDTPRTRNTSDAA